MNDIQINAVTGGYIHAAPLADIPGVNAAYNALLVRVAGLPFVPGDWLETVAKVRADNGNRLWSPRYAIRADAWNQKKTEPLLDDIPEWLKTPAAATAWNKLADWWKTRLQPILAGWARDEKSIMETANDEAVFWNNIYTVVKPVAVVGDAIISAPAKVAEVASTVGLSVIKKFWPLIAVVVVLGVVAIVMKNKLTKVTP